MNDPQANTLNAHLKSIAESLQEIARTLAQREERAARKATAKAQKRAGAQPKK